MTREKIIDFVRERFSVEAEYLWDGETHAVFRHSIKGKWFAIIMEVKKSHLKIECKNQDEMIDVMNVKLSPTYIEDLLHEEGFLSAYHMNKKHWISIRLDGSVSDDMIKKLIEESYDMVG